MKIKSEYLMDDTENPKKTILLLVDIIKQHNDELKNGNIDEVILASNKVIENSMKRSPSLKNIVVSDIIYGLNLKFIGLTGPFLFPSMLYNNGFRLQIIRQLKSFLTKVFTLNELGLFLSKLSISTQNVKKGGFTMRTFEILRFYFTNFDKIVDNEVNKYMPLLSDYKPKFFRLDKPALKENFNLTQKFSTYYPLPKFNNFGINSLLLKWNDLDANMFSEIPASLMGVLYNENKEKEFIFLFTNYELQFKNKL